MNRLRVSVNNCADQLLSENGRSQPCCVYNWMMSTRYSVRSLDEKDLTIASVILREPQALVEQIAIDAGIPMSTVQKRLSRMLQGAYIERVMRIVDWHAIGFPLRYRIDLHVNMRDFQSTSKGHSPDMSTVSSLKKLAALIGRTGSKDTGVFVQEVTILLGHSADLTVTVRARNQDALMEFLNRKLRVLPGVAGTATTQETWSSADGEL